MTILLPGRHWSCWFESLNWCNGPADGGGSIQRSEHWDHEEAAYEKDSLPCDLNVQEKLVVRLKLIKIPNSKQRPLYPLLLTFLIKSKGSSVGHLHNTCQEQAIENRKHFWRCHHPTTAASSSPWYQRYRHIWLPQHLRPARKKATSQVRSCSIIWFDFRNNNFAWLREQKGYEWLWIDFTKAREQTFRERHQPPTTTSMDNSFRTKSDKFDCSP